MPGKHERAAALHRAVDSARNLMPSAFGLAVDHAADKKDRWAAFDQVYEFVVDELQKQGQPLTPNEFKTDGLTPEQIETFRQRNLRSQVASTLLVIAYGTSQEAQEAIMYQLEELVPSAPDPETWKPPFTMQDQVILYNATCAMRDEFPEDWRCFFMAESEPVERRRAAFAKMYACIAGVWRENSDFARSIKPEERQRQVVLALMCHVAREQWTTEDLVELQAEMIPIDEPDWDALARQVGG